MKALRYTVHAVALASALGLAGPAQAQKLVCQVKTSPIVISKSGSYKLRSTITVPNANTTAIGITADNVTLVLNGFSILGPTVCSGGPPVTSYTPSGSGIGVDSASSGKAGTTVINGTVQGELAAVRFNGLFQGEVA